MRAVIIGSSTGGPAAVKEIIQSLPRDFPALVVVAQHLPIQFTQAMAKRLNQKSGIPVSQVEKNEILHSAHVYIIPGDSHFFILQDKDDYKPYLMHSTTMLTPSIDMGFTSIAEHFGPESIGVILTGIGEDGVRGAKAVKQFGGKVLVQDQATSTSFDMPHAVQQAGFADEILPLDAIAHRLISLVNNYD